MTTIRLHSAQVRNGVTFVDKNQDTTSIQGEHFIVIEARKVTMLLKKQGNIEVPIPVTKGDWGDKRSLRVDADSWLSPSIAWVVEPFDFPNKRQNAPERLLIDLTNVLQTFTVEGFITRFSVKADPGDGIDGIWPERLNEFNDVFQSRDILIDMFEYGGPIILEYGTSDDGFAITDDAPSPSGTVYRYKVVIDTLQFFEEPQAPGENSGDLLRGLNRIPQTLRLTMSLKMVNER